MLKVGEPWIMDQIRGAQDLLACAPQGRGMLGPHTGRGGRWSRGHVCVVLTCSWGHYSSGDPGCHWPFLGVTHYKYQMHKSEIEQKVKPCRQDWQGKYLTKERLTFIWLNSSLNPASEARSRQSAYHTCLDQLGDPGLWWGEQALLVRLDCGGGERRGRGGGEDDEQCGSLGFREFRARTGHLI